MKVTFDDIRCKVLEIINANAHNEVNRKTDIKKSGVYMLYVNCFDDDNIIPFYIGQTNDFQERFKQHFCELLSLNRLNYDCYKYALLKGLYNGHYRMCKIFSYMLKHNCEIKDFHMIILEEIDDEKERLKKEKLYINHLLAAFFGFNQMNTISRYTDFTYGLCGEVEFKEIINSDIKNMQMYSDYGYSLLNLFLTSEYFNKSQKELFLTFGAYDRYVKVLEGKKRLTEIKKEILEVKSYLLFQVEKEVFEICGADIAEFFSKLGLRSKDKQKLVVRVLLFDLDYDKRTLFKYFDRYRNRITTNIFELLNERHGDFIGSVRRKILSEQDKYSRLENEKNVIIERLIISLLPVKKYKSHPLKSAYERIRLEKEDNIDNVCYINIEYTCFKENFDCNIYPCICKIDYLIRKDGFVYSREAFIKSPLDRFWESDEIYYYESGFQSGPFNICIVGDVDTCIPVSMEYKNGINEYTLKGFSKEDEIKVFKEIDALVDEKTKIIYTTSGYKSTIKRYSEIAETKNILFMKRLIKLCR